MLQADDEDQARALYAGRLLDPADGPTLAALLVAEWGPDLTRARVVALRRTGARLALLCLDAADVLHACLDENQ